MVVKYERRSGVVTGARPFHAVLLAGTLAGQDGHQQAAEQFLRFAEPTAHDDWSLNADLKERYAHGAGARIREMYDRVIKALQQHVRLEAAVSTEGPAILKELFSLRVANPTGQQARWKLQQVTARPHDGAWEVTGRVAVTNARKPYRVLLKPSFDAESGRGLSLDWSQLESQDATGDGERLHAEAGTTVVRFTGRTKPVSGLDVSRCLLRLDARIVTVEGDE
jgi:hypothetical protein